MTKNPKFNDSGCIDLTAYEAIKNVEIEEKSTKRYKKLIATLFYICDLAGFRFEERVILKDKYTGKIYR